MHRGVVMLSAGLIVAALAGARPHHEPSARELEVKRLQHHFDSVDAELKSRDVSALSALQLARRAQLVSWLREYRDAATFPTNDKFTDPTPFFRDKDGVLCAMGYLIDRSGRSDIVNKVAATRNNAYIRELADDPALIAWLDSAGLSVAEAARIQPSYGGGPIIDDTDNEKVDDDFALAAIGLSSVSLASAAVNVVKPSYLSGFLGVIAGGAAIVVGANNLDENDGTDQVATATMAIGAASLGAGIYGLLEARRESNDHWRDRDRRDRRRRYSVAVVPDMTVQRAEPRFGLLVKGKF
ncbi:MAG TPA: hypothetical protein VJL35_05255 [Gemmatimonadaceae bacterium]|nr:hypothetical protein [Gemmatimonadaceae bacterium]